MVNCEKKICQVDEQKLSNQLSLFNRYVKI